MADFGPKIGFWRFKTAKISPKCRFSGQERVQPRNARKTRKNANDFAPEAAERGPRGPKTGFQREISDHRESSGPKTPARSIFLAKDAKGAKKHPRCPKPLRELGALCERNSSARMSGLAGQRSKMHEKREKSNDFGPQSAERGPRGPKTGFQREIAGKMASDGIRRAGRLSAGKMGAEERKLQIIGLTTFLGVGWGSEGEEVVRGENGGRGTKL